MVTLISKDYIGQQLVFIFKVWSQREDLASCVWFVFKLHRDERREETAVFWLQKTAVNALALNPLCNSVNTE